MMTNPQTLLIHAKQWLKHATTIKDVASGDTSHAAAHDAGESGPSLPRVVLNTKESDRLPIS